MMGQHKSEPQLFNYAVNLEKRVRANHPLRQVKAVIDFSFAREEVAHCYGRNGNESVPPEVILKMMFLLFFDDIRVRLRVRAYYRHSTIPKSRNLKPRKD